MTSRLLAFDAATDTLHLAATVGHRVWVRRLPGGAAASASLLAAVQALLAEAGFTLQDLDAVAYGRGPGAFTGLRTACSVAQGLAVGAGKPVIALGTLAAVAQAARRQGAPGLRVWAALDARMGEIYAALYECDASPADDSPTPPWRCLQGPALYTPQALVAAVAARPAPLAGNALRAYPDMAAGLTGLDTVSLWPQAEPDGAALAALARSAWLRGEGGDPADALPLYVRDKVAQTTEERALARRAPPEKWH
ncbi:MAG: tRNA (adenosine(37)-N6)-threonylcarbamoyltransferase complex dimerization subunit type 1 TsaB [Burkholderiales bacterium]